MPAFDPALLTSDQCNKNFLHWLGVLPQPLNQPDGELMKIARTLPATHTFPAELVLNSGNHKIYEEILFTDEALIAEALRREAPERPSRIATVARENGLDHYVFAYLGTHDPYYAERRRCLSFPFGVFLRKQGECLPSCNATRRDLGSAEATPPYCQQFLSPGNGRELSALETANDARHGRDYWRYWGAARYWKEPDFARTQWQWKIELHYRDNVPITDFEAILWPIVDTPALSGGYKLSSLQIKAADFRDRHPECSVIEYRCTAGNAKLDFVSASYAVARYLLETGHYPEDAELALEKFRDEL